MIKEKFYLDYLKLKKKINHELKKEIEKVTNSRRYLIKTNYNVKDKKIEIILDFYTPNLKKFVKTDCMSYDVTLPLETILENIREEIFYNNAEAFL